MWNRTNSSLFLKTLTAVLLITACFGGELSETEAFFNFIRTVDPENVLRIKWNGKVSNPCSQEWKGVKCNFQVTSITEIRLENLNFTGTIDADSICRLQNLQVLNLANNLIRGNIPGTILQCRRLTYLNLSSNLLSGSVPQALTKLKNLRTLDISNNHFMHIVPRITPEVMHLNTYSMNKKARQIHNPRKLLSVAESPTGGSGLLSIAESPTGGSAETPLPHVDGKYHFEGKKWFQRFTNILLLAVGLAVLLLFGVFAYYANKSVLKMAKERAILKSLAHSPGGAPLPEPKEEPKPEEKRSEFVFFVNEDERFNLDDLLEATADLRSQTMCSSLYKVRLKDNAVYAVKRLKKLQVSLQEFGKTMRQIGKLKHPNILPLVGFNSTNDEKLLIYKYQSNGSLLDLLEDYIVGKRQFQWELRLSIAHGIAKGLEFIHQSSDNSKIIPHGNLKLSNILLNDDGEPLISEYGLSKFLDPKKSCLFSSNAYTAPEKTLSEQGDVFSFGIILLELLTGKTVEKTGIDLPKWVKSMVREEWTGEVFDKEVSRAGREFAFPLLNIALKCVSNSPEERPNMAEVLEKIDEVVTAHEDVSISTMTSIESSPRDTCLLHTVIPEAWDTPGSNYKFP